MTNKENLKGKEILVVGLGRSGIAAAQALLKLGAKVSIQDSKKPEAVDGNLLNFFRSQGATFYLDTVPPALETYDMLVLSPGVSPELPFIQEAQAKGAEIIGELEIAYRIGKGNYVAITGTNGKTTTTTLVGEIFAQAGRKTHVVGNIGVAVIGASAAAEEQDWLVTECSSFQLETTRYFKPVVSAILNLTPDHLNRHHTMKAYGAAKAKIFANQREDGYLVINYDDKECLALAKGCQATVVPFSVEEELPFGAFLQGDALVIRRQDGEVVEICTKDDIRIIGKHNLQNVLAAAAICFFAGILPTAIREAIRKFKGVAHRIEFCGEPGGVKYYNDSKGTNVEATVTALKAIEKNILLIAGGDGKGQEFEELVREFPGRVKKLILLGRDAPVIQKACDEMGFTEYVNCKDVPDCVTKAAELAVPGDTVLLSPACASWDMYDNYEQRGDHFKECVSRLGV